MATLCMLTVTGVCGIAAQASAAGLVVSQGYVPLPPPGSHAAAAYLDIENHSNVDFYLMSVTTDIAAMAMIHEDVRRDHQVNMVERSRLVIPAHGTLHLQPGGMHIMLMNLEQPLLAGDDLYMNLHFSDGTTQSTILKVEDMRQRLDVEKDQGIGQGSYYRDRAVYQH
jgi:copper(I)-binding protein